MCCKTPLEQAQGQVHFQGKSSSQSIQGCNILEKSKLSSTVLFHEEVVATTGEEGFIFFHFISLYQALSLTFPCLSLLWNSDDCMVRKFSKSHLDHSPHFVNGISLEYYKMNSRSRVHKQQGVIFFQRNVLNWLQLNETTPYISTQHPVKTASCIIERSTSKNYCVFF